MNAQHEILQILFRHDKTQAWLADKLGITRQKLSYDLGHKSDISKKQYDAIMAIFRAEGFITGSEDLQKLDLIKEQLLNISQVNCSSISLILQQFKMHASDGALDFSERKELSDLIEVCRIKANNEFDKLQEYISKGA